MLLCSRPSLKELYYWSSAALNCLLWKLRYISKLQILCALLFPHTLMLGTAFQLFSVAIAPQFA